MFDVFFPDLIVDRVQNIDLDTLIKKRIKGLILDIDNTLVPHHMKEADENAVKWIEKVKNAGFKVCIVSNASRKRVIKFNENLKLFAIHRANKPGLAAFRKALRLMDVEAKEAVMIGDQVFTDVYGGNRMKMLTILVKPIHHKEVFYIKLKRLPEKLILSMYDRRQKKKISSPHDSGGTI